MPDIANAVLDKLRTLDTPTVCNLIELFEIRPRNSGYMDSRIRACFPEMPPAVGFAATATFRSAMRPRDNDASVSLDAQVERYAELSGPPVVVFQDLDDPPAAATFGEVMCTIYQAFGATGLITGGAGRDLDQVRSLDFPVFTNGTICAHGYSHIPHVHVPVHVGGITIYPDDLLHGDINGVTTIPHAIAAELADIGDEYVAAEGIILEALRSGPVSQKTLREARAESQARIVALRARVSRSEAT
jgi:4-hydroxy-4-methyl-2-oxoglutarate aldolase